MSDAHLDDAALSAILDGEEPPSAHLDGCDECRARSQELQAAARLIGRAVPPPDAARREAAIAAALAAPRPARTRWRPSAPMLAAAAVVLAIVALVPLLASRGDSGKDSSAAKDTRTAAPLAGDSGTSSAMLAPATIDAGDLGPVDDNLRQRIVDALAGGSRESAVQETPFTCDGDLRATDKKAGALVLFGRGTVNNRPAYVLVYSVAGSNPGRLAAYVVAQDSCADILQFASFSAPESGGATTGTR